MKRSINIFADMQGQINQRPELEKINLETAFIKARKLLIINKLSTSLSYFFLAGLAVFWGMANLYCWSNWTIYLKIGLGLLIFVCYVAAKVFGESEKNFFKDIEDQLPDIDTAKAEVARALRSQWFRGLNILLLIIVALSIYYLPSQYCSGSKKNRDETVLYEVEIIRQALDKYYQANGNYPTRESVLTDMPIRDNNSIYLERVPWPPIGLTLECLKFNEYFYLPLNGSYQLKYCLDNEIDGIRQGAHYATPQALNN